MGQSVLGSRYRPHQHLKVKWSGCGDLSLTQNPAQPRNNFVKAPPPAPPVQPGGGGVGVFLWWMEGWGGGWGGCSMCSSFYHSFSTLVAFSVLSAQESFCESCCWSVATTALLVVFEVLYGFVLTKGASCIRLRGSFAQVCQVVQFMARHKYKHSAYIGGSVRH